MIIPPSVTNLAGGIVLPSGIARPSVERRKLVVKYPHLRRRLVDPQLYLAELYAPLARKACANLASYGWFPLKEPLQPFDSGELKQHEWRRDLEANIPQLWRGEYPTGSELDDSLRLAITFQQTFGADAIVLPAPLSKDPSGDFSIEIDWLRRGHAVARQIAPSLPAYATVAVSDRAVRGEAPWSHDLLDIILDQVTAQSVGGVYLVLEQSNEEGYYITHPNTVGALLRLTNGFASSGLPVIVNFMGTAGLLLMAAGARGWCTGWYRTERRLKLSDFEATEGRASPAFYSHAMGGEIHLQSDMDRIVRAGFLPRVSDVTDASEGLMRALEKGLPSNSVPEWAHIQGNVPASIEHFLLAATRETSKLAAMHDGMSLDTAAQRWLSSAVNLTRDLYKIGGFNRRTALSHQEGWHTAFEEFLANR